MLLFASYFILIFSIKSINLSFKDYIWRYHPKNQKCKMWRAPRHAIQITSPDNIHLELHFLTHWLLFFYDFQWRFADNIC